MTWKFKTVNKCLVLVTTKHENNKKRTNQKSSHQEPANPLPYSGRLWASLGFSCAALRTDNMIRSTASCFSTTPDWNHSSTGRAFSIRYFHDYLSSAWVSQAPNHDLLSKSGGVAKHPAEVIDRRSDSLTNPCYLAA